MSGIPPDQLQHFFQKVLEVMGTGVATGISQEVGRQSVSDLNINNKIKKLSQAIWNRLPTTKKISTELIDEGMNGSRSANEQLLLSIAEVLESNPLIRDNLYGFLYDIQHDLNTIYLDADLENVREISEYQLRKKAFRGYSIGFMGIVICLFIIAGISFASSNITFQLVYLVVLSCVVTYLVIITKPYHEEMDLYLKRPIKTDQAKFVGNNRLMENDEGGKYWIYTRTAPCIYPHCHDKHDGKIIIVNAPPREITRLRRNFVGICDVAGKDHSYRIDHIWVATKDDFDWRDLEK